MVAEPRIIDASTGPLELAGPRTVRTMDILAAFGSRVREERERQGLSQEDLANRADLHRTYIGGVERGERNVSLLNLLRVARGLGVPASALLEDEAAI